MLGIEYVSLEKSNDFISLIVKGSTRFMLINSLKSYLPPCVKIVFGIYNYNARLSQPSRIQFHRDLSRAAPLMKVQCLIKLKQQEMIFFKKLNKITERLSTVPLLIISELQKNIVSPLQLQDQSLHLQLLEFFSLLVKDSNDNTNNHVRNPF